jgi:protein-tyrosine phosphatase
MVDFVRTQQDNGRQTYVHCAQGVSRCGLVVTAYFMEENGCTRDEALAYIRSKRPNVRPHPVFMKLLTEWESVLAAERDRDNESSTESG